MLTEGTAKSKLQMKDLVFKLNKAKIWYKFKIIKFNFANF